MAKNWYSYHTEEPKVYFEEAYNIYIDRSREDWERYYAINRMDKVLSWIAEMTNQDWAEEYVIDRHQRRFDQIRYKPSTISKVGVEFDERETVAYQHYFYIIELYDKFGRLIWTKIGATKDFQQRLGQHYRYYDDVYEIKTRLVFDTGDVPAEEVESKVRTYLLKRYGRDQYVPNDRFSRKINVEEIISKLPQLLEDLRKAEMR